MSGQILVSPDELRQHSSGVTTAANDARGQFQALRSRLSTLREAFQGNASQAFEDRYNEWDSSANRLVDALESLGRFLDEAARTVEDTDRQLASGLGS